MHLRVREIGETTKEIVFDEPTSELNPLLAHGPVHDFSFRGPAKVSLCYYRSGEEIFLEGDMRAAVVGECARCLEPFEFVHTPDFSFVMVPRHGRWAEENLDDGGGDLTWYEGEDIDLSPMLRERLLLALPTLPLCRDDCRGLCARCGVDLNRAPCECGELTGDPRLEVLRTLKPHT